MLTHDLFVVSNLLIFCELLGVQDWCYSLL